MLSRNLVVRLFRNAGHLEVCLQPCCL